jgi:dihydropteroate synthase type 2
VDSSGQSLPETASPSAPKLVGIVNLTRDSFSDGGRYLEPAAALDHAGYLADCGADFIEFGPASTHPDSEPVDSTEEIRRLQAIIDDARELNVRLAVDTFQPETQRWCIANGVDMINDVSGFPHAGMYDHLAASECLLVVMYSATGAERAQRQATDAQTVLTQGVEWLSQRVDKLTRSGVDRRRLIADPGMGFFLGATPEPSVTVLRNLGDLRRELALPLFVSVSRKSFLRSLTGTVLDEIGPATLAAELWMATQGVDYIRTHDVRALRDGLAVWRSLEVNTKSADANTS